MLFRKSISIFAILCLYSLRSAFAEQSTTITGSENYTTCVSLLTGIKKIETNYMVTINASCNQLTTDPSTPLPLPRNSTSSYIITRVSGPPITIVTSGLVTRTREQGTFVRTYVGNVVSGEFTGYSFINEVVEPQLDLSACTTGVSETHSSSATFTLIGILGVTICIGDTRANFDPSLKN